MEIQARPKLATARFTWHHELILQALRHPRVLRIILRRLLAGALP